jgi:REP element-mobilizing transposase RayT
MRTVRLNIPGVVYHLIWRFVDRDWFFQCAEERSFYLHLFGNALSTTDWRCLAYALMSSHIHVAIVAGVAPLASWARSVNSTFATWMNQRYGRIGNVFTRGPKDHAVAPDREGELIAYIHNNPVEARVVDRAADSDWTSHRRYLDARTCPAWLHADEGMRRAGFTEPQGFDTWVDATPGDGGYVDASKVRRELRERGALEVATPTRADRDIVPIVARPFAHIRPDIRAIVQCIVTATGIPLHVLASHQRNERAVNGRCMVVHTARMLGLTYAETASGLGIRESGARNLAKRTLGEADQRTCRLIFDWFAAQTVSALKFRTS